MRWRWLLLVVGAAAAVAFLLPPRTRYVEGPDALREPVRGIVHVHTRRSDGSGTIDEVAAAAARAGLRFVVFSDHGDATGAPEPPAYRHGVLCIDAIEISTSAGHVVALGLAGKTAYPLGGEPRDVIEDVARLGGITIVAHPTSSKTALRWKEWDLPFDGVEWLNTDSEWRDETPLSLARALLTYPFRRSETLATLLDRPQEALGAWDRLTRTRRVVGLAAADAHASLGLTEEDNPYGDGLLIALPDYEPGFRTFSVALPETHLTGNAGADALAVIDAIREGRLYSTIDAQARPARLEFSVSSGGKRATGGEVLPLRGPVIINVRTNAPPEARIELIRDGRVVVSATGPTMRHDAPAEAGVYRVEVNLPHSGTDAAPWIVSNPVYVGLTPPPMPPPFVATLESSLYTDGFPVNLPGIEKSEKSLGVLDIESVGGGNRLLMHYGLRGLAAENPYVALGVPAGTKMPEFTRIAFRARADQPMRLWVQLWTAVPGGNQYWRRSVYLDTTVRDVSIPFSEMMPSPETAPRGAPLDRILAVMFVVDQVHTAIGTTGQFWLDDVRYQR